jgi:2'-phosphotransferase
LNTRALKSLQITFAELRDAVENSDKKRFSMIHVSSLDQVSAAEDAPPTEDQAEPEALQSIPVSDDPADFLIRANQGHSIKVDVEGLLTPIMVAAGNVPETVVHGTDEPAWRLIMKSGGLRRMGRNHIHFASGLPAGFQSLAIDTASAEEKEAAPVISGMRKNSSILIYIDIRAALDAGISFYISENGVILTEGNDRGCLSYEFFKRVESRKKDGGVLMSEGKLPEGVVVDVEEWEREIGDRGKRGGRGGRGGRGRGRGGKARVNDDSMDMITDI